MKDMLIRRGALLAGAAALGLAVTLTAGVVPASAASSCRSLGGPGKLCIGSIGGQIQAYYEYTGSTSITGWLELGADGATAKNCTPGSEVKATAVTKLTHDDDVALFQATNGSNKWAATFYKGKNASDRLGTICAIF